MPEIRNERQKIKISDIFKESINQNIQQLNWNQQRRNSKLHYAMSAKNIHEMLNNSISMDENNYRENKMDSTVFD